MARVFILLKLPLLGQGVETLLRQQAGSEIVGRETDTNIAIERIAELQPDVVLVDNGDPASDLVETVTRILKMETPVKVIGLDEKVNKLYLYHREQREANSVKSLVDAINSQLSPVVQN